MAVSRAFYPQIHKFINIIVDPNGGGDYTTLQAALDACTGGVGYKITLLPNTTYPVPVGGFLFKGSNVMIEGDGLSTVLSVDASVTATSLKANGTTYSLCGIKNVKFSQTNGTHQGVAIDWSNIALGIVEDVYIENYSTGIKMNDTANHTFYNHFAKVQMFGINGKAVDITSTNPANNNWFLDFRIACDANGTGLYMNNSQGNCFINFNAEPASSTGTVGVDVQGSWVCVNNTFINPWLEGNSVGLRFGSSTQDNTVIGGLVVGNTTDLADTGYYNNYIGVNISYSTMSKVFTGDEKKKRYLGALAESFDMSCAVNTILTTSQSLYGALVGLNSGDTVTNINCVVTAAAAGATSAYVGLVAFVGGVPTVVAISGDIKTSLTSTGFKSLALTSPYQVVYGGPHYLMIWQNGGTQPTLARGSNLLGLANAYSIPRHFVNTSVASFPAVSATITPSTANTPYALWLGCN